MDIAKANNAKDAKIFSRTTGKRASYLFILFSVSLMIEPPVFVFAA
jgi:hypothetical protein